MTGVIEFEVDDTGDLLLAMLEWPEHAAIAHVAIVMNHPRIRLKDGHIDIRLGAGRGRAVYRIDDESLGVYTTTLVYAELW